MTGYGRAVEEFGSKTITVEVKSLNSKYLDLKVRLSQGYRSKEMPIRKMVTDVVHRGKVDVQIEIKDASPAMVFDKALFAAYYQQIREVADELSIDSAVDYVQAIARFPNVIAAGVEEVSKEEWNALNEVIKLALKQFTKYRSDEGASIEKDFRLRAKNIMTLLGQVEPFEEERIVKLRERFRTQLEELTSGVDENRFEQELIFYMEKLNLSEEKVRLRQHCEYFIEQLDDKKSNLKGKTLNFIAQEMGREINTLGSKANSANIQKIVVQMKDELEKIKEQVANAL